MALAFHDFDWAGLTDEEVHAISYSVFVLIHETPGWDVGMPLKLKEAIKGLYYGATNEALLRPAIA